MSYPCTICQLLVARRTRCVVCRRVTCGRCTVPETRRCRRCPDPAAFGQLQLEALDWLEGAVLELLQRQELLFPCDAFGQLRPLQPPTALLFAPPNELSALARLALDGLVEAGVADPVGISAYTLTSATPAAAEVA